MNRNARSAPRLLGIGTALPRHSSTQERVLDFMLRVLESSGSVSTSDRIADLTRRIYRGSGVERRQSVIVDFDRDDPMDFEFFPRHPALEPFPTTERRMRVYEAESIVLAEEAARRALRRAGVPPESITHIVVSTCTGFFAPGLDVLLVERLGASRSVERTVIGFMGCYAGLTALRAADRIARADPGALVLVVAVELCTLHYQKRPEPDLIVANALFSDGAAAAVVGGDHAGNGGRCGRLLALRSGYAPESLEQMTWRIGDHGFEMRLAAEVPATLRSAAAPFVDSLLVDAGRAREDVRAWAAHPGGPRILSAIDEALSLERGALDSSRSVLRDHGNMSSATIFFVIERELARRSEGTLVALAFGPGLTIEGAVVDLD
ncbi:MAG TPA: type III polyketide synthase [Planctomycetota bacterium]|nr:type III polyketide synthase [Planctomycetota bacterium]